MDPLYSSGHSRTDTGSTSLVILSAETTELTQQEDKGLLPPPIIEELECATGDLPVYSSAPEFQLAQDSEECNSSSSTGYRQQEDEAVFSRWMAGFQDLTPQSTSSELTTPRSFIRSSTEDSTPIVVGIRPGDPLSTEESFFDSSSDDYGYRSLPMGLPETSTLGGEDGVSRSVAYMSLIQEQGGYPQGTSMCPLRYLLAHIQQQEEEVASLPESLPSLTSGNQEYLTPSHSTLSDALVEGWETPIGSSEVSVHLLEGLERDGDTVATTISTISCIRVREIFDFSSVGGFIQDIPYPEQDDPPDSGTSDAASQEIDREIEQI